MRETVTILALTALLVGIGNAYAETSPLITRDRAYNFALMSVKAVLVQNPKDEVSAEGQRLIAANPESTVECWAEVIYLNGKEFMDAVRSRDERKIEDFGLIMGMECAERVINDDPVERMTGGKIKPWPYN